MRKNAKRFLLVLLLVFLTALGIGYWRSDDILTALIQERLLAVINQSENSLYSFGVDQVRINGLKGDLVLENVSMTPKSFARDSMARGSIGALAQSTISKAELRGLEIIALLVTGKIYIDKIGITSPRLTYYVFPGLETAPGSEVALDVLSEQFVAAAVDEVSITAGSFSLVDMSKDSVYAFTLDSLSLNLAEFEIDTATIQSPSPFRMHGLQLDAASVKGAIAKYYDLEFAHFSLRTTDRKLDLEITSPHLVAVNDKFTFNRIIPHEMDWFDIKAKRISLEDFELFRWFSGEKFFAKRLIIDRPEIYIYKDKRPKDKPIKRRKMPNEGIRSIPVPFEIDSILIQGGSLTFEQQSEYDWPPGAIHFTEMYGVVDGLSNDPEVLKDHPNVHLSARALLMGQAPTQVDLKLMVMDPRDRYTFTGKIGALPFSGLNPFLENIAFLRARKGQIRQLSFAMKGDREKTDGTMDLHYEDLKIEVLKVPKNEKKRGKTSSFLSFTANTVVKHNNLPSMQKYRQGLIKKERTEDVPFMKYYVQAIGSGLVSTIIPLTKKSTEDSGSTDDPGSDKKGKKKKQKKKKADRKAR